MRATDRQHHQSIPGNAEGITGGGWLEIGYWNSNKGPVSSGSGATPAGMQMHADLGRRMPWKGDSGSRQQHRRGKRHRAGPVIPMPAAATVATRRHRQSPSSPISMRPGLEAAGSPPRCRI
jgi:hypothetical protein